MATKYKNPWHSSGLGDTYGPEFYATDVKPTEYRGFLIYHRHASVWDVVKDGVCLTQMAGFNGAKARIDLFAGPLPPEGSANRFWYDRSEAYLPNGFQVKAA